MIPPADSAEGAAGSYSRNHFPELGKDTLGA